MRRINTTSCSYHFWYFLRCCACSTAIVRNTAQPRGLTAGEHVATFEASNHPLHDISCYIRDQPNRRSAHSPRASHCVGPEHSRRRPCVQDTGQPCVCVCMCMCTYGNAVHSLARTAETQTPAASRSLSTGATDMLCTSACTHESSIQDSADEN